MSVRLSQLQGKEGLYPSVPAWVDGMVLISITTLGGYLFRFVLIRLPPLGWLLIGLRPDPRKAEQSLGNEIPVLGSAGRFCMFI